MVHRHACKKQNEVLTLIGICNHENEHTLQTGTCSKRDSYWNGLYVFVILGFSVTSTFTITLIPLQNQVEFPAYWYETSIGPCWTILLLLTCMVSLDCYVYFNIKSMVSIASFLRLFVPSSLSGLFFFAVVNNIWTLGFGYNLPVPFNGVLWIPIFIVFTVSLWFEFPYRLRNIPAYRKRLIIYIIVLGLNGSAMSQYDVVFATVSLLPTNMQWTLAFVLPLIRGVNIWILDKFIYQAIPCNLQAAKFGTLAFIRSTHTLFVAINLANVSKVTLYCILGIEFLLHFYSCYQIIGMQTKVNADGFENEEQKENVEVVLLDLVVSETIELLAALAYSVTFAVAFYGPNATILGNIGNSYWTYEKVHDIRKALFVVFQMALIDLQIGIVCGIILWRYCRINLFQEFCTMMKSYWSVIALRLALLMTRVS